MLEKKTF